LPGRALTSLLRPLAGRRLPRKLRAHRVGVTARHTLGGLRDPALCEFISRIDGGAPIHHGNRVRLFTDGAEATAAMLGAIANAEREVLCEAYIFTDDETGHAFRDALSAAAVRGVRVCVLADAWGSLFTGSSFWRGMEDHGVEVRLFHRFFRHLWWHAFRDHRKILVADRRLAYTGGMNIADEYSGSSRRKREERMRDTHLEVAGSAAVELAAVFAEGWERAGGRPLDPEPAPESAAERAAAAEAASDDDRPRVHVLDSRPDRGHHETASVLATVVALAEERLWVTAGYFAPGRLAVRLITAAARRGVDVRLLLPGRSDVPIVRHAGHGWYRRLLAAGVRVFEYRPAILHAKTLVADGAVSIVGSSNLDVRSFRFNAECNLVVIDGGLAGELETAFERDLAESEESDLAAWRRRNPFHRAADRVARWLSFLL
jgi:cardiolipin synthase